MTTQAPTFTGLHAVGESTLPFAPDLALRAFVLERDHGNVLVYSTDEVADRLEHPVRWHYLNHWHEAMFGVGRAAATHHAPVVVHEDDAAEVVKRARNVRPTT